MERFETNPEFTALADDALDEYQTSVRAHIDQILALGPDATVDDIAEGEALYAHLGEIDAARQERVDAAAALADRQAALAAQMAPEPEPVEEPAADVAVEEPAVEEPTPEPVAASARRTGTVATLARQVDRPPPPAATEKSPVFSLTASADSGYAAGSEISLMDLGFAAVNKLNGTSHPEATEAKAAKGPDLTKFAIGKLRTHYPEDLVITRDMGDEATQAVLEHACNERRLPEGSLVASAGWCAPSEIYYNVCAGEVIDGIWDTPTVQVQRGGFKRTKGTDFSTVYAGVGFQLTEAQAISGTAKTCYEVPCPSHTDFRLDAIGICVKVPILLEQGYPEQVEDIMRKSVVAHAYKKNASNLANAVTIAGAAKNPSVDLGSLVGDTLSAVDLVLDSLRQKYRLGVSATLEVVFPAWTKNAFRNDLGMRTGRPTQAVSDAEIMDHFNVRKAAVQFVWGYGELNTTNTLGATPAWPTTMTFMAYPAGTFVQGVADVINISAVYDAASLVANLYTGIFLEEGLLLADMCYEAVQVVIPLSLAGNTGAADIT